MHIIGLAGAARSGKDTIANHLTKVHGYRIFSFSDALYREVADAFIVGIDLLRDGATKDTPQKDLALRYCRDSAFISLVGSDPRIVSSKELHGYLTDPRSPRWLLQTWGTEYRRGQDPDYWLHRASDWVVKQMRDVMPDMYRLKIVNTSVRFPNEYDWIRRLGGEVWHVRRRAMLRDELEPHTVRHESEKLLPVGPNDTVIYNNGSINSLWTAITMKLTDRSAKVVRVEPEE